jgi:hypothetical protein
VCQRLHLVELAGEERQRDPSFLALLDLLLQEAVLGEVAVAKVEEEEVEDLPLPLPLPLPLLPRKILHFGRQHPLHRLQMADGCCEGLLPRRRDVCLLLAEEREGERERREESLKVLHGHDGGQTKSSPNNNFSTIKFVDEKKKRFSGQYVEEKNNIFIAYYYRKYFHQIYIFYFFREFPKRLHSLSLSLSLSFTSPENEWQQIGKAPGVVTFLSFLEEISSPL